MKAPSTFAGTLLLALLLAAAASALAQGNDKAILFPPPGAHTTGSGNVSLAYWVGSVGWVDESVQPGEPAALWFGLQGGNETRLVAYLNVTSTTTGLAFNTTTLMLDAGVRGYNVANTSFQAALGNAEQLNATYSFAGEVYEDRNGTLTLLGPINATGAFSVTAGDGVPVPLPPPGVPTSWLVIGGLAVLVGGGGAIYGLRQRAIRRKMNQPRRSQVLREMAVEKELERAEGKDPEKAAQIKQEIRAAETVREKRRELQILEARRADALKTMDLLKKRHESGALSKLQYDNMVAKKQQDLAKIDAEIAAMEGHDPAAAS